jgi:hypothetical protein
MIPKTAAPNRVCPWSVENIRMSKCRKHTGSVDGHSARLLAWLWIGDRGSVSAESNAMQVVCVVTEIMYELLPELRAFLSSGYRMLKRFSGTGLIHLSLSVRFFHLFSYPLRQLIHKDTSLISLQNADWVMFSGPVNRIQLRAERISRLRRAPSDHSGGGLVAVSKALLGHYQAFPVISATR